ncbi:uncharacterized protein LOC127871025 isoform X2 [Dreissena polymorpha]|uniref:uncharacterized protein LOC127871025 isoform X2 n=1 Tax=Dreissena polymorpha TaxID=45954 RepID=UPI0022654896|nr:uncharacterized protein LOC127871025 isoform X2 [Dreissena polymorpha]
MDELEASPEPYMLVDHISMEEFQTPLTRSTRLKFNCVAVSTKLVACGSNTGGIYVFSRQEKKLLQIAFADKETNSVAIVKISPHEKYIAFTCGGSVHVLDLKLDSRSKAETLRSSSDLGVAVATYLSWDDGSGKLYIGDDLGRVHLMMVYANKAMNLFAMPLEVIMKLDSTVIQIDGVADKIVVSTVTRCYLCDTKLHTYTQIGKKLRDGNFGACFLQVGMSLPMIYSARPGSRIWEVDIEGNVLNTHQFKQLLAAPPVKILKPELSLPEDNSVSTTQSVSFTRLQVLNPNFILTWTMSSLYVLDPVNVKVVLWCKDLSGILDICCVRQELYIFLDSMEIHCLSFLPVTGVLPLYLKASNPLAAAQLCLKHRSIFSHKKVQKRFCSADLMRIYNKLLENSLVEMAEEIHELMREVNEKIAVELDSESSEAIVKTNMSGNVMSAKQLSYKSSSENDSLSVKSGDLEEVEAKVTTEKDQNIDRASEETDNYANGLMKSQVYASTENDSGMGKYEDQIDGTTTVPQGLLNPKKDVIENQSNERSNTSINKAKTDIQVNVSNGKLYQDDDVENIENVVRHTFSNRENIIPSYSEHWQKSNTNDFVYDVDNSIEFSPSNTEKNLQRVINDVILVSQKDIEETEEQKQDTTNRELNHIFSTKLETAVPELLLEEHWSMHAQSTADLSNKSEMASKEHDNIGFLPKKHMIGRRSSLTSLSSMSSADVTFDMPHDFEDSTGTELIAIPVIRKKIKKKKKRSSSGNMARDLKAKTKRSLSLGQIQISEKEFSISPSGSFAEVMEEEDSISLYSNDSVSMDTPTRSPGHTRDAKDTPDNLSVDFNVDSVSGGSPSTQSADFTLSEEFGRSEEFQLSGDAPLGESIERESTPATSLGKGTLKQFKDKVQYKVTTKTKTLIKNIKDKNLLTKVKDFAGNLSQGSENFRASVDGVFMDFPRVSPVQVPVEPSGNGTRDSNSESSLKTGEDNSKGGRLTILKHIVDISLLKSKTAQVNRTLEDIETLTNPELMKKELLSWVNVLNATFCEMHLKKYGSLNYSKGFRNEVSIEKLGGSNISQSEYKKDVDAIESNCDNSVNDLKKDEKVASVEQNQKIYETNHIVSRETSSNILKIIKNEEFAYVKDPLTLPHVLLKEVSELAQACFDLGCHGDILEYQNIEKYEEALLQYSCEECNSNCDSSMSERHINKSHDSVDLAESTRSHLVDNNKQTSVNESVCFLVKSESMEQQSVETCVKENTVSEVQIKFVDEICDLQSSCLTSEHLQFNEKSDVMESYTALAKESDNSVEETSKKLNGIENVTLLGNNMQSMGNALEKKKTKDEEKAFIVVDRESENKADLASAFFVRCYFPYLSCHRVRSEVLSGNVAFHTWSALVTCMEVLSQYDSEKYGIEQRSIIGHLLETQAHKDGGALLLGHLSRLFQKQSTSAVDLCVRCHPHVLPLDVLYMCRKYDVAMETIFKQYMNWMCQEATSSIKSLVLAGLGRHPQVLIAWLEILLADSVQGTRDSDGKPVPMGNKVIWRNEDLLGKVTKTISGKDLTAHVIEIFRKCGYWTGVLRLLKSTNQKQEHFKLIVQLRDIQLLQAHMDQGCVPDSLAEWKELLEIYKSLEVKTNRDQSKLEVQSDLMTFEKLAFLLVRYLGPDVAVLLLDEIGVQEGELTNLFYRSCLLSGTVQRHHRLILHSMLEKVDSYLWSQRPTALLPQVHYLAMQEKDQRTSMSGSKEADLSSQLRNHSPPISSIEDPEIHWGLETRTTLLCPCCNISLKEPVSQDEPGLLIFKCGHGFHKHCLPGRRCLVCQ